MNENMNRYKFCRCVVYKRIFCITTGNYFSSENNCYWNLIICGVTIIIQYYSIIFITINCLGQIIPL